ncbi:MAG TPA: thioredoxin family protein [Candidatus Krumholzibacteriaceae bacterium]|nr:thioredoxin family protein [Candidatus Krumholzibacteriaceae bacterium]
MKIQILGTGCSKCEGLAEAVKTAGLELGLDFELEKITDIEKIISFGVMMTPALVVDGDVKLTGKVPAPEELKKILTQ